MDINWKIWKKTNYFNEKIFNFLFNKLNSLFNLHNINIKNYSVLEIGSGWGSFAFYLISKFPDIKIDTLTISKEQYEFVKTKIREHHLENKLNVIYKDYREHQGEYSRIYSIEMFEAVGEKYWSSYFDVLRKNLKTDGSIGLQTITIEDKFFQKYKKSIKKSLTLLWGGGSLPGSENIFFQKCVLASWVTKSIIEGLSKPLPD